MHFELTEEQVQMKMSVREFAEAEIAPHVMEWDEAQHFPVELLPKLGELGLLGILFPEKYGGAGLGYVEYATAIEELSRVDGSVGISVAAHNSLCSNHIYQFGTEAQKQKYLTPLAQGKHLGAWGLTEPGAGSDASGTRTSAAKQNGGWLINGSKNFITHAIHADTCVAFASSDRAKQSKGITAFIFEKGMKGFSPSKKENKLGLRASETGRRVWLASQPGGLRLVRGDGPQESDRPPDRDGGDCRVIRAAGHRSVPRGGSVRGPVSRPRRGSGVARRAHPDRHGQQARPARPGGSG